MRTPEQILQKMIQEMPFAFPMYLEPYVIEAMKIYAIEACREALKNASEKATTEYGKFSDGSTGTFRVVDKGSILSESNIPKELL